MANYRIHFAMRWGFDPRQLDAMYITEFDHFVAAHESLSAEEAKQQRELETQSAKARR